MRRIFITQDRGDDPMTGIRESGDADAKRATAAIGGHGPAVTSGSLRTFVHGARRRLRNED